MYTCTNREKYISVKTRKTLLSYLMTRFDIHLQHMWFVSPLEYFRILFFTICSIFFSESGLVHLHPCRTNRWEVAYVVMKFILYLPFWIRNYERISMSMYFVLTELLRYMYDNIAKIQIIILISYVIEPNRYTKSNPEYK